MEFENLYKLDDLYSSYRDNDYKFIFYGLARVYKPQICVEIGVLEGYSLCATAMALKDNRKGIIYGFDLWEHYPYRAVSQEIAQGNVDSLGLTDYARLYKANAYDVPDMWPDDSVDWIHVDLSNDGDKVDRALNAWRSKLKNGGLLLLEGGSDERDRVEWMTKYEKQPIAPILRKWDDTYEIFTFELMAPSLTMCQKRGRA